uniref:HEAT repeat-containing PBS lyase n=1 Tax=Paulinella micropora TaxID=1928728 RepID=A0A385I0F1_9EUKA|nr:HEAT repeat-containing PBS lyase [Paulinella micropora]AXY63406.1 HEAT repeat-containing PBS lyase [Paulinella micropora]
MKIDRSPSSITVVHSSPSIKTAALIKLKEKSQNQTVFLLILGIMQDRTEIRSLCCSGLGVHQSKPSWNILQIIVSSDEDATVRAEALNSIIQYSLIYGWNVIRQCFVKDSSQLVRCTLLSMLLKQRQIPVRWLIDLSTLAIADNNNKVRLYATEIFGRLSKECTSQSKQAREILILLQDDIDHQVATSAINSLCN